MAASGDDIIGASGLPPFFRVAEGGLAPPEPRLGEAVRVAVRSLSGFQKEALVVSARTGATWRMVSDEGPYLNGHDAAPCPLAFLTAGMAASFLTEIAALAAERGVAIGALRLTQDNFYTMRGSMAKRTMTGGAEPVELVVEIECELDDAALRTLVGEAVAASPLNGLLRGVHESLFKLSRNGAVLAPDRVAELDAPLLPDPAAAFADVAPETPAEPLMIKAGKTPKKDVAKGTAAGGSSLADEQDRRLNIGAIATIRPDGIKEVRQMTYSPHGSSFVLLSDEAQGQGGQGRAPDAMSYAAAGIAFCFMTQFGRFASMLKLDLPGYRIVQDTHFSLGGASGGTGMAGRADPVETHVYLETGESDEVAREMLDVAERTCFLHALCRTDLKTGLRVRRVAAAELR
jgi:organic hydroperoxide reductase OsmC/OhrA